MTYTGKEREKERERERDREREKGLTGPLRQPGRRVSERGRNHKRISLVLDPLHLHSIRHVVVDVFRKGSTLPLTATTSSITATLTSAFFRFANSLLRTLIRVARNPLYVCNICRPIVARCFACSIREYNVNSSYFAIRAFFLANLDNLLRGGNL